MLFRRTSRPRPGRGPVRWTIWEIGLIVLSLLLIVFPLYAEVYTWINPPAAPAAGLLQRVTDTPIPSTSVTPFVPTDTPTTTGATNTPTTSAATNTPTTTGATNTPTTSAATNTPTTTGATNTPTATPGQAPLTVVKVASVASAGIGQQFSYSIAVYNTSATIRSVTVQDVVPAELDIIGTPTASSGTCNVSGNTVTCTVNVSQSSPATIIIRVRVRATATVGSVIRNTAGANDGGTTAQSDDVLVEVANIAPSSTPPSVTSGPTNTPTSTATTPTPTGTPTTPTPTVPTPTITPGGPTLTPTITPGGPTLTPTNTPRSGPTNTPRPGEPTNTPRPGEPTSTSAPGGAVTPLPRPPLPPTPRPGQPLPPTPRPGQRVSPTPRPGGTAASTATTIPGTPGATATPTVAPAVPGLFFRMASDWGSAFPGQKVNYVIVVSNTRASGAMTDLVISAPMPANLDIISAKSDRGRDPTVSGNTIALKLDALQPGEGVEIAIETRIKASTAVGTQLISQAQLTFSGLTLPAYSNIVTVLIVGAPAVLSPNTVVPLGTAAPATALATATSAPTPSATATATPSPTTVPTATVGPAGAAPGGSSLPNTSSGVPIAGFALFGMTLMLRTVRLHREQSRI